MQEIGSTCDQILSFDQQTNIMNVKIDINDGFVRLSVNYERSSIFREAKFVVDDKIDTFLSNHQSE